MSHSTLVAAPAAVRIDDPAPRISAMRAWLLDHLPQLNRQALAGELPYTEMAGLLNLHVLRHAPAADSLSREQALQMLVLLSFTGSSVERHAQQQLVKLALGATVPGFAERATAITPGRGIAALRVRPYLPFQDYFRAVADRVGHPHRDTLMTLIDLNGPDVEVRHPRTGAVIHRARAAFADGRFLTFSDNITEINFFTLGKQAVALQEAANHYLQQLQDPSVALDSPAAVDAALTAAHLMWAIKARMLEFMKRKTFDTDFFLDVFRQYQCSWGGERALRPPSAANDTASLTRDLILFDELLEPAEGFPGYRAHAQQVCSVLFVEQALDLCAVLARASLEARIFAHLGLPRTRFAALDSAALADLVARHPWLLAYQQLYNAQRDLSHSHYALVAKFIVAPKRRREQEDDAREYVTVVNNARGVTGLDPMGVMVRLDEARDAHPLARLNGEPAVRALAAAYLPAVGFARLPDADLLALSRLAAREPAHAPAAVPSLAA
jgi:hypothetical protein